MAGPACMRLAIVATSPLLSDTFFGGNGLGPLDAGQHFRPIVFLPSTSGRVAGGTDLY